MTHFLFCLSLCLTYGCQAQKKALEIIQCSKGNTGFKGRVPKEDIDKPNTGKDFYEVTLKALKKSTVEIVDLTVLENGGQMALKPTFENDGSKITLNTGEKAHLRVEKGNEKWVEKSSFKGEGRLTLKVNNVIMTLPIEKFEAVLPQ